MDYENLYEDGDISKEYDILVFKYAALLSNYINATNEINQLKAEIADLKEELKSERVKYGTVPLPKVWK